MTARPDHRLLSFRALWTVACLLAWGALLQACPDDDTGSSSDGTISDSTDTDTGATDTGPLFDTGTATDTQTATDTGVAPDSSEPPDSVQSDTGDATDTSVCDGFGCPCQSNADCLDELCVEGPDGQVCTELCVTQCPDDGYRCLPITVGGSDPFNACVPQYPHLCKPCNADADCANALLPSSTTLCLPQTDSAGAETGQGSFCATSCDNVPCPDGFSCVDQPLLGGGVSKQCVPTDGTCECRDSWSSQNLTTTCAVTNSFGSCEGSRACGTEGLTACLGDTPAEETCNLVDDDCDAETDEETCDDALMCTVDSCVAAGECTHEINANACVIDGACVAQGTPNPAVSCQICDPAVSQTGWSSGGTAQCIIDGVCHEPDAVNPAAACQVCDPARSTTTWSNAQSASDCDDGNDCTMGDQCTGGACIGTLYSCDDGVDCNTDICNGDGTCQYVQPDGPEICDNQMDDDCDGATDESEVERCGDVVDNDCDGLTDESGDTWGQYFFARPWRTTQATVAIYPSNDDGTFADRLPLTFPQDAPYSPVAIADVDGDRFLDLIVSQRDLTGKAACSATAPCATGQTCWGGACHTRCTQIETASHDGTDAACAAHERCVDTSWSDGGAAATRICATPVTLSLAREGCSADANGPTEVIDMVTLDGGESVGAVVDANNDGHLDLVILRSFSAKRGYTLINNQDFSFTRLEDTISTAAYNDSSRCVWGRTMSRTNKDLNGDGLIDVIGACWPSGGTVAPTLWWWQGNGDGTFSNPVQMAQTVTIPANLVTVNDFDSDGDMDIIAGLDDDGDPGGAEILLNSGRLDPTLSNSFVDNYEVFDLAPSHGPEAPGSDSSDAPGVGNGTSFDFDRNGYPDVLVGWVPEDQCTSAWTCSWTEIGLVRNVTENPCGQFGRCNTAATPNVCVGCQPQCEGRECGFDRCGGTCGSCGLGEVCQSADGQCVSRNACEPVCNANDACGDNGCGGQCGYCDPGESCVVGAAGHRVCDATCVPDCSGKICGGEDGCGGQCALFTPVERIDQVQNQSRGLTAPSNAPPTAPGIRIIPANPTQNSTLFCGTVGTSYDLDVTRIEYRWFRNDVYAKDVGDRSAVPAVLTANGDVWRCEVRVTDGTEWSPRAAPVCDPPTAGCAANQVIITN